MTPLLLAAVLLSPPSAMPIPDLRTRRPAGPLLLFPDDVDRRVFYYPPGEVRIATRADGSPDLVLFQTRVTRDSVLVRSLLSVRVELTPLAAGDLAAARSALIAEGVGTPELRPLPIRRLEAGLVYALPGAPLDSTRALPPGQFEATGSEGDDGYWSERIYTVRLDRYAATLFTEALARGAVAMSLGYAFFADGIAGDSGVRISGSPAVIAAVSSAVHSSATAPPDGALVSAGATEITADLARYPEIVRQVDLDASALPGYPLLAVRAYDFRDRLRPDLYARQVDLEANGLGGRPVRLTLTFDATHPDLVAQSVRFPHAVDLRSPWRYRVRDIANDGTRRDGGWTARTSWVDLLDVTTQVETPPPGAPATDTLSEETRP